MKIFKYFTILAGLSAAGCDDAADPRLLENSTPAVVDKSLDGTSYVLEEAKAGEIAATFKWSPANFGYQAAVSYTLEASLPEANFDKPVVIGQTNSTFVNLYTDAFNSKLFSNLKIKDGVETEILIRVKASVSNAVKSVYSKPIKIKVTPYAVKTAIGKMWVPGSHNGWTFNDVVYSIANDGMYQNYLYFPVNAEFLFTPAENWDNKYGGANGTLREAGENILVKNSKEGIYLVEASIPDMTYKLTPTDWGIIGSAVGSWDKDVVFTWDAVSGTLVAIADFTTGEEFKFRANRDWSINFGAGDEEGKLKFNAENIRFTLPSGKYKVNFYIKAAEKYYTMEKI